VTLLTSCLLATEAGPKRYVLVCIAGQHSALAKYHICLKAMEPTVGADGKVHEGTARKHGELPKSMTTFKANIYFGLTPEMAIQVSKVHNSIMK
jgi:hypothetical protein